MSDARVTLCHDRDASLRTPRAGRRTPHPLAGRGPPASRQDPHPLEARTPRAHPGTPRLPPTPGGPVPRIAREVVVDHSRRRLLVDGEEFPWFVGTSVNVSTTSDSAVAWVGLEVLADHVVVIPRGRTNDDEAEPERPDL